jgi:hypothetical protein
MTPPPPGIYPDVPASEYHAWPYASASRMGDMARSPLHCRHRMANPESTDAMVFGEAFHLMVLQDILWDRQFAMAETCQAYTKNGGQCGNSGLLLIDGEWRCGVHGKGQTSTDTRRVLSEADVDRLNDMANITWGVPASELLLLAPGPVELSIVWDCPTTGVRCKGRVDKLVEIDGRKIVVDLKTTGDASAEAFAKSIANYGYHRQAAHYLSGLAVLGEPAEAFMIIAVEKEPPHGAQVFELQHESIELGANEITPLIARYGECQRRDNWPGYAGDIRPINLPEWKLKELNYAYED